MMFYKRIREIDVPEMMASIIYEATGNLGILSHDDAPVVG